LRSPLVDGGATIEQASEDFKLAAAVSELGMLLRGSPDRGRSSFSSVRELAIAGRGRDVLGYRQAFSRLIELAAGRQSIAHN
jgi:Ca-activated chloride channel family protein